ncbi:acyl-CoA Delta(11) desaturase-like [Odontomachus brunneus]|uniref:acyl-CoA Delta(11) desaturase-like n=1 Tax=Odontomachus brunneus TaxID=486640 RepID=UPI0013F1DCCB|nr:acyl-CoA Delta(11) desaturase-like [Odontomachus brunneus]
MESKMPLNNDVLTKEEELRKQKSTWSALRNLHWLYVPYFIYAYVSGLYGTYLILFEVKFLTVIWGIYLFHPMISTLIFIIHIYFAMIGVTAGTHRLWAHRSYKAKWPLRLFLMILQTSAFQFSIYSWCRNYRLHHKFSDTDADPHNADWLMIRTWHPDVTAKRSTIDLSDLDQDPIVAFQQRWYFILLAIFGFILPILIPYWFLGETLWCALFANMCWYNVILNNSSFVNSVAHKWGMTPYDKTIRPKENFVIALLTLGEGWYNYHHTFPWDYRTSEFGKVNPSAAFINFCAFLGLANDLKITSPELIKQRVIHNNKITHINKDIIVKEESTLKCE